MPGIEITGLPSGVTIHLLETDNLYVSPGESPVAGDIFFIRGYNLIYNETAGYYDQKNIDYITSTAGIFFDAYKSGYAYVRFAESDLSSASYVPIRSGMEYTLSSGAGEKTVSVQFKKTDGKESEIYPFKCCLSGSESGDIDIVDVYMEPQYHSTGRHRNHGYAGIGNTLVQRLWKIAL